MFMVVRIPIADGRKFANVSSTNEVNVNTENRKTSLKLHKPGFPFVENGEFIKGFGQVYKRKRSSLEDWPESSRFFEGKGATRVGGQQVVHIDGFDVPIAFEFRRLFSDGVARHAFEFGVSQPRSWPYTLSLNSTEVIELVLGVHKTPIHFAPIPDEFIETYGPNPEILPLSASGRALSRLFAFSTSSKAGRSDERQTHLVHSLPPFTILMEDRWDRFQVDGRAIEIDRALTGGVDTSYLEIYSGGIPHPVWIIHHSWDVPKGQLRNLRLALSEQISEIEYVKSIFRMIEQGHISYHRQSQTASELDKFVHTANFRIGSKMRYGIKQWEVLQAIDAISSVTPDADLALLQRHLEGFRSQDLSNSIMHQEQNFERQKQKSLNAMYRLNGRKHRRYWPVLYSSRFVSLDDLPRNIRNECFLIAQNSLHLAALCPFKEDEARRVKKFFGDIVNNRRIDVREFSEVASILMPLLEDTKQLTTGSSRVSKFFRAIELAGVIQVLSDLFGV